MHDEVKQDLYWAGSAIRVAGTQAKIVDFGSLLLLLYGEVEHMIQRKAAH